jgi:hypothetical protein
MGRCAGRIFGLYQPADKASFAAEDIVTDQKRGRGRGMVWVGSRRKRDGRKIPRSLLFPPLTDVRLYLLLL